MSNVFLCAALFALFDLSAVEAVWLVVVIGTALLVSILPQCLKPIDTIHIELGQPTDSGRK